MLDGWVPAEVHEYHYDDEGRVSHVQVHRESQWSTHDQERAEALILLEAQTCRGCGNHLIESTSPDFVGLVDHDTCYGCRAKAVVERDDARKHEKDPKPAPGRPVWSDGRMTYVREAEPHELLGRIRPE